MTRLTQHQAAEAKWFVEAGKAKADNNLIGLSDAAARAFYQSIIDRADALLPVLTGKAGAACDEEEDPPEDEE